MLDYNKQYDIAHGIFITFNSNLDYRLLHSKHKQPTREKYKSFFPYKKFESRKKETLVLSCLYVMFYKVPSSFQGMLSELRELDFKDVAKFKHKIMNYDYFITEDVKYLKESYGSNITLSDVYNEYVKNNIQFYTLWWFQKLTAKDAKLNRTQTFIYNKIKSIMLFLTFKESSIKKIQDIFSALEL